MASVDFLWIPLIPATFLQNILIDPLRLAINECQPWYLNRLLWQNTKKNKEAL
jgi:hypothetical protein